MSGLFWLSDAQWVAIAGFMPKNQPGARRVDDRRVISGIIHVLRAGCRWIDCPKDYGPHTTIYNRFNRWSRRRFWSDLLEAFANAGAVTKSASIDSTYIKAQRAAFGGKGGPRRKPSARAAAARRRKSTLSPMSSAGRSCSSCPLETSLMCAPPKR
jgi:transposase